MNSAARIMDDIWKNSEEQPFKAKRMPDSTYSLAKQRAYINAAAMIGANESPESVALSINVQLLWIESMEGK